MNALKQMIISESGTLGAEGSKISKSKNQTFYSNNFPTWQPHYNAPPKP